MGRLYSIWGYISRYKYVAAALVFLFILGVLDENSLWIRFQRRAEIATLMHEIDKYQKQYEEETARLQALQDDPKAVERMAREVYLMKRPDEDIFVFRNVDPSQIQSRKPQPVSYTEVVHASDSDTTMVAEEIDTLVVAAVQQSE